MKNRSEIETEFLAILEKNMGSLVKVVNVYAYHLQDKEDLMNDIIFELWRSFPKFRGDSKISTWLFRVALNVSLKSKRKGGNGITFVEDIRTVDNKGIFETYDDRAADIERMYECISGLNSINKAIILLYLENKSNEEIASIVGISRTNVSTRLGRIREELKNKMNQ